MTVSYLTAAILLLFSFVLVFSSSIQL
uniref:Uncharacterized protein n=1 Tax=Anguilla anguilla TaxID=7936 RepID=A0A0E9SU84_ANGAN